MQGGDSIMESIFPTSNLNIEEYIEQKEELPLFKEYAWNFKENKFILENGKIKILEGKEALKVWIIKALRTPRFKYMAYSWDYGQEFDELVSNNYSIELLQSEVERLIKEALEINKYIKNIRNCNAKKEKDIVYASFTVITIYGEIDINV
jgi:hypothetical protein